jgi:hypothetical protein
VTDLNASSADELEKLVHSFDVILKTDFVDDLVQPFLSLFAEGLVHPTSELPLMLPRD